MLNWMKSVLRPIGLVLIGPTIVSLTLLLPEPVNLILAIPMFFLGSMMAVGFLDLSHHDSDPTEIPMGFLLWELVSGALALATTVSVSRTTLLISCIVYGLLGIMKVRSLVKEWIKTQENEKLEEQKTEREKFAAGVMKLVGDDKLARGFILALERLTEYVPDEGTKLLQAVTADLERYTLLESLIPTTQNDVLRMKAEQDRDEIATEARALCAELTEEALEAIQVQQSLEADRVLDDGRPQLVEARKDFGRYLSGLKEVRGLTPGNPSSDKALRDELDKLSPQPEVRKISSHTTKRISRQ